MAHARVIATLLVGFTTIASAQIITIRTVPVAQGDQFDIFPSKTVGMGGVSIALADTLLDSFRNPAKGSRVPGGRFFGSPTFYSVSGNAGGGRTLPIAAFARRGLWYGGLSLALQEVDASRPPSNPLIFDVAQPAVGQIGSPPVPDLGPVERSHGNGYAFAHVGRTYPAAGLSLGGSLFWAGLHAIDGVDLLYAGSERVRQRGHALDIRAGLLKEWAGGRSLEAVLVHNRYGMTHDVTYLDFFWDPNTQTTGQRARVDENLDKTNIWGLHLQYERPLQAGWRIGWLATVNQMTHPKIPNYEIMSIPRDPGYSSAFNVGMGLSRTHGRAQWGFDVIYEPIWSYTWADAAAPVETASGGVIPVGGKTIENRFRFSNVILRMGAGHEMDLSGASKALGIQFGLAMHSIGYRLDQYDNVQLLGRAQEERWLEWSPTWGLSLRFPELEIRYRGRVTNGTGRPGVTACQACRFVADGAVVAGGGILAAPSGPLTLQEVKLATHQFSISLPLR